MSNNLNINNMENLKINLEVKLSQSFGQNGFKYKVYFTNNQNNEYVAYDDECQYPYKGGFGKQLLSEMTVILNENKELMDVLAGYTNWRDFLIETLGFIDVETNRIVKGSQSAMIGNAIKNAELEAIKKIRYC